MITISKLRIRKVWNRLDPHNLDKSNKPDLQWHVLHKMKRNNNKKVTVNTQMYYTLYSIQSVAMTCMMKINHTLGWIFPEQEKTCLRIPYHASIARQTHNYSLTSTQLYLSLPLSLDEGTDPHTIDLLYTHEAKKPDRQKRVLLIIIMMIIIIMIIIIIIIIMIIIVIICDLCSLQPILCNY